MTRSTARGETIHAARPGSRPMTAEDLWKLSRVGAPAPHPDGTACVVPVVTWDLERNESRSRLWWAPRGGAPRALTSDEFSSADPVISPDGRQLAFTRKRDQGKAQLHVMPLDGGEARCLTRLPLGVFDPRWLPDGSGLVFGALVLNGHFSPEATAAELARREKDPVKAHVTEERVFRYWDQWLTTGEVPHLFLYDLARDTLRDLTPDSDVWFDWMEMSGNYDISPDGREIALSGITRREPGLRTYLYTVAIAGGPMTCLTGDHPAHDATPRYSPDGATIVYGMQHDPDFYADRVRLMVYDRVSGTHREACPDFALSPSHWTFGRDGTLFLIAEEHARTSLFAWKSGAEPTRIVRGGTVSGIAVAAGRAWFVRSDLSHAPEVYVQDVAASGASAPEQVTHFTDAMTSQYRTGEVREVGFEGSYGAEVQMFVVLPPDYEEGTRYPLVQVVHGGPHGISGDAWSFRWNAHLFAAPGYVAALVNFQGSTSWGQDFAQRIQGRWGDQPYLDVMRATDVLVASGLVDERRMAVAGGSYGGYLVTWIEGHTDRFRCIVNHAGIYDTLSFHYASDVTQGRHKSLGGQPWDGLEGIDRYNPSRFTAGFKTPMLVIHGERDFRVPAMQGLACYGVLKARGIPARLVYFPDENHWVLKARNSLVWYREVHAWLDQWLKEDSMDPNAKKTALRMIPYGLYVLTAANKKGEVAAATVNWVTQTAFEPPLVVVGVKTDSHAHPLIKETKAFALNVLGKGQQALAFTFFKPADVKEGKISGEAYRAGSTGAPILASTPAYVECTLESTVELGDHSVFVGKVVDAGVTKQPDGRADDATLWLKELGDKVFYGG